MTDTEIIELYLRRDERAIAETQKLYGHYCEKIARNVLGSEQEAQECVNDAYLKAWETIPPERPRILVAYLAKITRNSAISRYRREKTEKRGHGTLPLILDELSDVVSGTANVEKTAEDREIVAEIDRFLETLPETKRRIFILRFVCCEGIEDIAKRTGVNKNNVSVTLNRVKKQLKQHLNKEGYEL